MLLGTLNSGSLKAVSNDGAIHGLGAKPPKYRLASTVKHTGQESGGESCEIFKF